MCSHEHLCVVAVPTTGCFQYVCPLSYFYSIGRGIATCCGDIVCTVCNAYPAAFLFCCVMCLYFTLFQLLLSLFIIPLAVAYNASLGGLSPLIGVFMS